MKNIIIKGNKELQGVINISGAKNSAVALIPAALLSDEEVVIKNVPNISDIDSLVEILEFLDVLVEKENGIITINCKNMKNKKIPESISSKLRASYYFMSALLGKYKFVEMFFPGGCSIGARPIDQTLKAFESLSANINEEGNFFTVKAEELVGNDIYLDMPSVGATINAILVSAKAKGKTIIHNAAKEPEIINVIDLLNNMGANIKFIDNVIEVIGVSKLAGATIEVIPDRIEAGTYIIAGALVGNNLKINNINTKHLGSLLESLEKMGANLEVGLDYVTISKSNLSAIDIKTDYYPGFPTDLQQPFTTLLTQANGVSNLTENIYENRFQNVKYLQKMGSDIVISNKTITINGKSNLIGNEVVATDLRAGACLVLAALVADGTSLITEVEHILRGYDDIIGKLKAVGADIK